MDPKPPSGPASPVKDETLNTSSECSDNTRDGSANCTPSLTQSPPIQVMERPEDFDLSNRFSSPSSGWSSASDESLFSIHITTSCPHDQSHLFAADALSFVEHYSQIDTGSLKDVNFSDLDEPQKVVRWKTQVERLADEGVTSPGQQPESTSLTDHKTSEPKRKFWWSTCNCGSCKMPKCSCWNGCWKNMNCSNCKPKKIGSPHSKEANAPTGAAPKKPDSKPQKPDWKKRCCSSSWCACAGSWSCPCHCCLGEIST